MAFIMRDFQCLSEQCQHQWEDLVRREEENEQKCPECGSAGSWIISATNLASYSLLSREDQAKSLRKRSRDHTRKQLKKDPTSMKMSRHVLKR